jgi:hypothetical protein
MAEEMAGKIDDLPKIALEYFSIKPLDLGVI